MHVGHEARVYAKQWSFTMHYQQKVSYWRGRPRKNTYVYLCRWKPWLNIVEDTLVVKWRLLYLGTSYFDGTDNDIFVTVEGNLKFEFGNVGSYLKQTTRCSTQRIPRYTPGCLTRIKATNGVRTHTLTWKNSTLLFFGTSIVISSGVVLHAYIWDLSPFLIFS
jgi:hypothetical protein